jgi:murein DD-endopeptidase MepM/ murein hydrolase activator NlpD
LVVLTISTSTPASVVRVRAFDHNIPSFAVNAGVWKALVGIDLVVTPGTYQVAIEASTGPTTERTTLPLVVKAGHFPTRTLTVDEAFVNPPASALERIARETRQLTEIWESSSATKLWAGRFVPPVPDPANSAFGTRSILNGQPRSPHGGADFRSPAGRPIQAPNSGRVVLATSHYYTGNTVVIDHGLGLFSLFAHLSVIDVKEGDVVKTGDIVGKVGATGRVTGPHLHWTVRTNGARVDPVSLLSVLGTNQ